MPSGKIHRAISENRTEKDFAELHKWIDKDEKGHGVEHRKEKHYYTNEWRDEVFRKFGGNIAVSEWLFHIALDNLDTSVTNDWMHKLSDSNIHKFGFKGDGFIFYEEDEVEDACLINEFKEYEEEGD